jgi:hypothetical protein
MNRREFTKNISLLILDMCNDGEQPIEHECWRSAEQQNIYFHRGVSKCDGYEILGNHQKGTAEDLYLTIPSIDGQSASIQWTWDKEKSDKWHKVWEEKYGGKPLIIFANGERDDPHFEG